MKRLVFALAMIAIFIGCGDPPATKYPDKVAPADDARLGAGDVFDVRVFYGAQEMTATYRVNAEGTISFPYIGTVKVAGKTVPEVEEDIQTRLADGFLRDPVVSLLVKESNSKRVSVFGQVGSAGTFAYSDGMTIVDAIAQAGGFTPMARKNAVTVTRANGKKYTVHVESIGTGKAPNFPMRPGDVIFVPERRF